MSSPRLLWLDLETSGLDEKTSSILAVGAEVTDFNLARLADPFEVVLKRENIWPPMKEVVLEMHTKSGLLSRCYSEEAVPFDRAYHDLLDYITSHVKDPKTTYLAGSSIHFDRRFLARHMPLALEHFSYRMFDVSTFKVLASAWYPNAKADLGEVAHLPLLDIEASKKEFRFRVNLMFRENEHVRGPG